MSLAGLMIDQIGTARAFLEDGKDVVPSWRISTPEGTYLIFTCFDTDTPEQRTRALHLISRFMTWKLATSFVLTAETWLGGEATREGEEALLVIGISRHQRLGLIQRIEERDPLRLRPPEWLTAEQIDDAYIELLPAKASEITAEEIAELTAIFGKDEGMEAERLS